MPVLTFLINFLIFAFTLALASASDIHISNVTLTNVIVGSCHNARKIQPNQPNIWKSIQDEDPDIFVWGGDAVYPHQRKLANLTYMKQLYDNMHTNDTIGYKQLQTKHGIYGTWDDHDLGANDAGRETPDKSARAELYYDFLKLPSMPDTLKKREGLYYSVTFGDEPTKQVTLIFLDTRWHRARHCLPSVATYMPLGAGFAALTRWIMAGFNFNRWWPFWDCINMPVLGEEQWQWLESELDNSQAAVHVVVSSIQVLTTNPTVEGWGHFPNERQRLIKLLGKGVSGLFLVSGDVHQAEVLNPINKVKTDDNKHSFLEVTSSGMTHYCSQPFYGSLCEPMLQHYNHNRHAKSDNYYIGRNYGRLEIDWDRKQAEMFVRSEEGNTVLRTGSRKFQQDALTQDEVDQVAPCIDGHMIKPFLQISVAIAAVVVVGIRQYFKAR